MLRPTIGCSAEGGRASDEAALRCKCCRARCGGQRRQASDGMTHRVFLEFEVSVISTYMCTSGPSVLRFGRKKVRGNAINGHTYGAWKRLQTGRPEGEARPSIRGRRAQSGRVQDDWCGGQRWRRHHCAPSRRVRGDLAARVWREDHEPRRGQAVAGGGRRGPSSGRGKCDCDDPGRELSHHYAARGGKHRRRHGPAARPRKLVCGGMRKRQPKLGEMRYRRCHKFMRGHHCGGCRADLCRLQDPRELYWGGM